MNQDDRARIWQLVNLVNQAYSSSYPSMDGGNEAKQADYLRQAHKLCPPVVNSLHETCADCGQPVYQAPRFWDHVGMGEVRHIAQPQFEQPGVEWTQEKPLDNMGWYCAEDRTGMKYMVYVEDGKTWSWLSKHEQGTVDDFVWWYGPLNMPYRKKVK